MNARKLTRRAFAVLAFPFTWACHRAAAGEPPTPTREPMKRVMLDAVLSGDGCWYEIWATIYEYGPPLIEVAREDWSPELKQKFRALERNRPCPA